MILSSYIFETLWSNVLDTTALEFVAVVFGLMSVWFAKQEKILVYPTGIISVLIYVYICFGIKLYADAGINLFYFVMSVYGWYNWAKNGEQLQLRISKCNQKDWLISVVMFVVSAIVIILLLKLLKQDDPEYWSTSIPYIDTFTTAIFIVGMWLMAFKKLENWIFWIVGDVISVPLYAYKGLVFTSFQFLVFLIIAIAGYIAWRKKIIEAQSNSLNNAQIKNN